MAMNEWCFGARGVTAAGWRHSLVGLLAIGLAACSSTQDARTGENGAEACPATVHAAAKPDGFMALFENAAVSADNADEARALAARFCLPDAGTGRRIDPTSLEFFRNSDLGRKWLRGGRHRAIAFGFPASQCPYYYTATSYSSRERAVAYAMVRCLDYVSRIRKLFGERCACRLGAVDDALLGPRDGFAYRSLLPTVLFRARAGSGDFAVKETGFLEFDGRSGLERPIRLLDRSGAEICSGTYSTEQPAEGRMRFSCRDEPGSFTGRFRVLGFRGGRAYGFANARSRSVAFHILFGLSEKNFAERWRDAADRLKP